MDVRFSAPTRVVHTTMKGSSSMNPIEMKPIPNLFWRILGQPLDLMSLAWKSTLPNQILVALTPTIGEMLKPVAMARMNRIQCGLAEHNKRGRDIREKLLITEVRKKSCEIVTLWTYRKTSPPQSKHKFLLQKPRSSSRLADLRQSFMTSAPFF